LKIKVHSGNNDLVECSPKPLHAPLSPLIEKRAPKDAFDVQSYADKQLHGSCKSLLLSLKDRELARNTGGKMNTGLNCFLNKEEKEIGASMQT